MQVHIVDEDPPPAGAAKEEGVETHGTNPFGTFQLTEDGAFLMPYEKLINPDVVKQKPLHFPWKRVKAELDKLGSLGQSYRGRRLYLLYNPATGHTMATTSNFFATMTIRPKNIGRPPASSHCVRHQLLLLRKRIQHRRGQAVQLEVGRLDAFRAGLGDPQSRFARRGRVRVDHSGQPAEYLDGIAAVAGESEPALEALGSHTGFTTNRPA